MDSIRNLNIKKILIFRDILRKECKGDQELISQVLSADTLYPQHKWRLEKVMQEFKEKL